jgi:hypothetical protein
LSDFMSAHSFKAHGGGRRCQCCQSQSAKTTKRHNLIHTNTNTSLSLNLLSSPSTIHHSRPHSRPSRPGRLFFLVVSPVEDGIVSTFTVPSPRARRTPALSHVGHTRGTSTRSACLAPHSWADHPTTCVASSTYLEHLHHD